MKYQYGPGLPGYGTQGADGSNGLLGIGFYYSSLSGDTAITQLNLAIGDNKFLNSTGDDLPDGRNYQFGDMFVDPNGKAWVIDPNMSESSNRFYYADSRLNTSTIFTEGPPSTEVPIYERYSNSYAVEKFLVDTVYSNSSPANYAASPSTTSPIYGIAAVNFAKVNYSDMVIGDYIPFDIFTTTIDTLEPEKSIALVKHAVDEFWRLGNYDACVGVVRDVSLSLDFAEVDINGKVIIKSSGASTDPLSIINSSTTNYLYKFRENLSNEGQFNMYNASGTPVVQIATDGTSFFRGGNTDFGGDVSITGDLEIRGNTYIGNSASDKLYVVANTMDFTNGSGYNTISFDSGPKMTVKEGGTYSGYLFETVDRTTAGGQGGAFSIDLGFGGANAVSSAGAGGGFVLTTGRGGTCYAGGTYNGGDSGAIRLTTQVGGNSSGNDGGNAGYMRTILGDGGNSTSTSGTGGEGAYFKLNTGKGGDGISSGTGAGGGYFTINADNEDGEGGTNDGTGIGGAGGLVTINTGRGGHGHISTADGNDGGELKLQGAGGGNSFGGNSGNSGNVILKSLSGGTLQGTASGRTAGNGGNVLIEAGLGGYHGTTSSRSGNGGNITIKGGAGGAGTVSTDGLLGGDVSIHGGGGQSYYGGDIFLMPGTGIGSSAPAPYGRLYLGNIQTSISVSGRFGLQIDADGLVSAANTGTSDIRLKTIDASIINPISKLKQIDGFTFHWNNLGEQIVLGDPSILDIGLSAQAVEMQFPELVSEFVSEVDPSTSYKTIDYIKFIPIFVEAFKEQQLEIEGQNDYIEALEEDVDILIEDVSTLTTTISDLVLRIEALEA